MDVLTILISVIFPQCIWLSNHHIVYFEHIQLYLSIIPQYSWGGKLPSAGTRVVLCLRLTKKGKGKNYLRVVLSHRIKSIVTADMIWTQGKMEASAGETTKCPTAGTHSFQAFSRVFHLSWAPHNLESPRSWNNSTLLFLLLWSSGFASLEKFISLCKLESLQFHERDLLRSFMLCLVSSHSHFSWEFWKSLPLSSSPILSLCLPLLAHGHISSFIKQLRWSNVVCVNFLPYLPTANLPISPPSLTLVPPVFESNIAYSLQKPLSPVYILIPFEAFAYIYSPASWSSSTSPIAAWNTTCLNLQPLL